MSIRLGHTFTGRIDPDDLDALPYPGSGSPEGHSLCADPDLPGVPVFLRLLRLGLSLPRLQSEGARTTSSKKSPSGTGHTACATSPFTTTPSWWIRCTMPFPCLNESSPKKWTSGSTPPMPCTSEAFTHAKSSLMHRAGFHTLRLGLETARFEDRGDLDTKVTEVGIPAGGASLLEAGFRKESGGGLSSCGTSGSSDLRGRILYSVVKESGITPILAHYTPIPHTRMWPEAVAVSRYDLEADPIFTNNALWPCRPEGFSWAIAATLKRLTAS